MVTLGVDGKEGEGLTLVVAEKIGQQGRFPPAGTAVCVVEEQDLVGCLGIPDFNPEAVDGFHGKRRCVGPDQRLPVECHVCLDQRV